jgi:hypothetical protein
MKKITPLLIIVFLINTAFQCETPPANDIGDASTCGSGKPEWLLATIASAEQNGSKGEIIQYQYKGETVFSIDTCVGCPDSMTVVYNCVQETKCQFGGIAGLNTCPDFTDTATGKKIIWAK